MKKIFSTLCFALFGAAALMTSCSDVPAPYDIFENGGQENGPEATVGEGTKESPYDVATAKNNSGKTVWVQGYIVGVMENLYDNAGEFAGNEAKFEAPFTIKTNIIIASDPEETNIKNCLPVKVKGGSDLSNALNLVDHADNLGKLLIIQGTIGSGFGSTSLNETTAAILDGTEIGQEQQGGDETPSGNILFQESFASGQGDFQIKDISKGELDYVWKFDSKYGMKASAYNGKQVAAESWLISPEIDLTNVTTATLTFDHAINQLNGEQPQTNQIVEVSTNNGESWTPLTGVTYPEGTSWTFVNAGNVDLKAYAGAKILIGFHYKSTNSSAATWEIKNVKVYSEQTETGGEVTGNEVQVTPTQAYEESFAADFGKFTLDDKNLGGLNYVWKIDTNYKYAKASAYNQVGVIAESWLVSPVIDLSQSTNTTLTFMQASYSAGLNTELMLKIKEGNNEWTDLEMNYSTSQWEKVENNISLSNYDGKKVQIAFVYKNDKTSGANTWEVWNVKVSAGNEGGSTDPEPTPSGEFTSNIKTLPESTTTDGNKASGGEVKINGQTYPILKLGTGSAIGKWESSTLTEGNTSLSFYAVGWGGKSGEALTISIKNGGSFDDGETSKTISLIPNEGAANSSPFTITPSDNDFKTYILKDITTASTIEFSTENATGDKRAILFGINIK